MNCCINFEGDWTFHGIMADLGVRFAMQPFHRIGFEIDDAGVRMLAEKYSDRIFRVRKWAEREHLSVVTLLLRFDEDTFVIAHGDGRNYGEVIGADSQKVSTVYKDLRHVLEGDRKTQPAFYMLRFDCGDFSADPIENLPEAVGDDFLRLCYGEDILDWISEFRDRTLSCAGGLTIFDGPPGTGKTSLITQMIHRLENTHVFYALPVSQDEALSSPEMVPFWQKQNARHADRIKVIVMEDAERLLWRRNGDNREAVSSLLNIADGLMGRMLRLHVVCSINARMEDLDPAILRPGRLTNHRRFDLLSRETAGRIADSRNIRFDPDGLDEEFTLAEILNPETYKAPEKACIGFERSRQGARRS